MEKKNPSKVVEQKSIIFGAGTPQTVDYRKLRDFSMKYIIECLPVSYTSS